jgi:peptidoglycan/LPS O-acetylase OafA/YrhL
MDLIMKLTPLSDHRTVQEAVGRSSGVDGYRPDIDGLRAIAVLAVIGFHAGVRFFGGGYVGVDIFFVISGFLITSIICKNLERGTFTFRDFYARRAKRIFPALILVLFAVCAYGWLILLPGEFVLLGKHILAGAGFVSNLALWNESGYFDKAAQAKPLLHLWSLGIEEQFYLLWPPLMILAWKRRVDALKIAAAIVGISFTLNVVYVSVWQVPGVYYLPLIRFWELLAGCALACLPYSRVPEWLPGRLFKNIQAVAGLVLIFAAVFGLNSETLFPGWWALLPVLGTSLLISAGPAAWINRRLLSSKAIVFIGLISYPLYLWHWPILSYLHIVEPAVVPPALRAGAVALAFLLAWLTFEVVEKPMRLKPNRWALACVAGIVLAGFLGTSAFIHQLHARSEAYGFDRIVGVNTGRWNFPPASLRPFYTSLGNHYERGTAPKVLFVGDSHMQQYYPRIEKLMNDDPNETRSVSFVTELGCPPVFYVEGLMDRRCKGLVENAFDVADALNVDTVVIAAAWFHYSGFRRGDPDTIVRDLTDVITRMRTKGRRVYLILPIPNGDVFAPSRLVTRSFRTPGFSLIRQIQRVEVDRSVKESAETISGVARATGAIAIDPIQYICPDGDCPTLANDGLPIFTDSSHLRAAYVREQVTFLDEIVLRDKKLVDSSAIIP